MRDRESEWCSATIIPAASMSVSGMANSSLLFWWMIKIVTRMLEAAVGDESVGRCCWHKQHAFPASETNVRNWAVGGTARW